MKASWCNPFMRSVVLAGVALLATSSVGYGQYRMDSVPQSTAGPSPVLRIVDKAGTQLPMDLPFTRYDGQKIAFGDLFHHNKPVIVSLVYFSCPNLCGFNQDALKEAVLAGPDGLSLGKDFDIVIVSIDPDDTPDAAAKKRAKYLDLMNRKPTQEGFTYLTGTDESIAQLSSAVGFPYSRNFDGTDKFAHDTGIFICTADGKLSHTISGISYPADELHFRLREAANGTIGSGFLSLGLSCGAVHYNPRTGKYEANPWFYVGTATGVVTLMSVAGLLLMLNRFDGRRRLDPAEKPQEKPTDPTA